MFDLRKGRRLAWAALLGCFAAAPAEAQTYTWNGPATGSQSWSLAANWTGGAPVGSANTTIAFGNAANNLTVNLDTGIPFVLNQLQFNFTGGAGFTLAGGTLDFTANGATQPTIAFETTTPVIISSTIRILGTTLTLNGTGGGDVLLTGQITGTGGLTVANGAFTANYLTARSDYTGATTISGSSLVLATSSAIDRRSTIALNGNLVLNPAAGVPSGVPIGSFDQRFASISGNNSGRLFVGNAIAATGFDNAGTTFNGIISSSPTATGGLLKAGTGTLVLAGANTYAGPTLLEGGGLTLGGANGAAASSSGYSIAAGTTFLLDNSTANANRLRDASPVTLRGGTLEVASGPVTENVGVLSATAGAGTLNVAAGNTLSFTTYSPGFGTVFLQNTGTVNFRTTAPATIGSGVGIVPSFYTNGDLVKIVGSNAVPLAPGDYTTFAAGIASSNVLDASALLAVAVPTTFNAIVLQGAGGQAVSLAAPLTLTAGALHIRGGTAAFTGTGSLISPGTLFLSSANSGVVTFDAPITAANLSLSGPGLVVNLNRLATIGANGVVAVNNGASLFLANNGATTSGGLANATTIQVLGTFDVTGVSGGFLVPGGTAVQGSGTVTGVLRSGTGSVLNPTRLPGPAKLTVQTLRLEAGGRYDWVFNSVVGATGSQSGEYTQSVVQSASLDVSSLSVGNTYSIRPITLKADNTAGPVSDFDPTKSYTWELVKFTSLTGTIAFSQFTVDPSQFANSLAGGTLAVGQSGNSLVLQFTPVPEPGGLLLLGAAGLIALRTRRRID